MRSGRGCREGMINRHTHRLAYDGAVPRSRQRTPPRRACSLCVALEQRRALPSHRRHAATAQHHHSHDALSRLVCALLLGSLGVVDV